jgi:hypothetical protein
MKFTYKVNDRLDVCFDSDVHTDAFETLMGVQEVFGISECGCCKSKDLRYSVRTDKDDNKYYDLKCQNISCRAVLSFGQKKKPKGALYPRRKKTDESKEYLPNGGWVKWVPIKKQ